MFGSIIIVVLSLGMLVYWFRYTCMLLLQARQGRDYAKSVIQEHCLTFRATRENLDDLIAVERSLDRDYLVLARLMSHMSPEYSFEVLLLKADYALMRVWWKLTANRAPRLAGSAIGEMAAVLADWSALIGLVQANRS